MLHRERVVTTPPIEHPTTTPAAASTIAATVGPFRVAGG